MENDQQPAAAGSLRIPAQQDPAVANGTLALRGIWVAIIVLTAVLASTLTCVVFLAVHAPLAAVIGAPGAIFLGIVGTGVNVVKFLTG